LQSKVNGAVLLLYLRDSGHLHCSGAQQLYTVSNCAG